MPRRAPHAGFAHRLGVLLAIALLLGQFVAPVIHQLTAHSHPHAADPAASHSASTIADDTGNHSPATCSICQSIHQHRTGFVVPAIAPFVVHADAPILSRDAESFAVLCPALLSAPPRGPPAIA